MNAPNDDAAPGGFGQWWAAPPRSGLRRLINPLVYRHLRVFGSLHIAGGLIAAIPAIICLSYGVYGWAAFFLAIAAANVAGGSWYLSIARAESA